MNPPSIFPSFLAVPPDLEAELLDKTRRYWHTLNEEQRSALSEFLSGTINVSALHNAFPPGPGVDATPLECAWLFMRPIPHEMGSETRHHDRDDWHYQARTYLAQLP